MDRQADERAIIQCIHRYTRGVDRLDRELILSSYHPDAIDYHGAFHGSPTEFCEWLWQSHIGRIATQHYVSNFTFDFDGDTAHVETYFMVPIRRQNDPQIEFSAGRYVDRFEKRDGEWKIALRVVVSEWHTASPALPIAPVGDTGLRTRDDVSYERPLTGPPPPQHR